MVNGGSKTLSSNIILVLILIIITTSFISLLGDRVNNISSDQLVNVIDENVTGVIQNITFLLENDDLNVNSETISNSSNFTLIRDVDYTIDFISGSINITGSGVTSNVFVDYTFATSRRTVSDSIILLLGIVILIITIATIRDATNFKTGKR